MSQLGEINEVEVIKADGTKHKVKLQTIGVKRSVPATDPETPESESPAADP